MYKTFFKRFLDIMVALIALPFFLIVLLLVAPLIFFSDRGPVFYNALRMGKDGKNFKIYKFRSMRVNAPDIRNADGSTFSSESDPRVTSIGRFLRKTSIDELPQLINVLKGDMSIVGPRPNLPASKERIEQFDEFLQKRIKVRPGITGYTQAYYRNSIPQNEKFKHDAYYVDNISFVTDLKIIFQTFKSVIKRENVYVNNSSTDNSPNN